MIFSFACFCGASFAVWLLVLGGLEAFENERADMGNRVKYFELCDTEVCREVADAITNSMNRSVDPCVDFYEFSCGRWESNNLIPEYKLAWDTMSKVSHDTQIRLRDELEKESRPEEILPIQLIKKYYQSCMTNEIRESEGLARVAAILRETNGWPMIMNNGTWNEDAMTWQEIDDYYENLIGGWTFYSIYNYHSPTELPELWIHNPVFPVQEKMAVIWRNYNGSFGVLYRSLIEGMAQSLIEHNKAKVFDENLEEDIDDLLKFEEKVYEISRNYTAYQISMNISRFLKEWNTTNAEMIPQARIDWEKTFKRLSNITDHRLTNDTLLKSWDMDFFVKLRRILEATDKRTIVNYIQWNFLSKVLPYTTAQVEDIFFEFTKSYWGIQTKHPRSLWCAMSMDQEHAAAYLFIKKYWRENTKETAIEMTRNIKEALELQINNSNWLPTEGKNAAIEKLNRVKFMIGYPDWYDTETDLIDYYKGLTVGGSYFENALKFMKHGWKMCINDYDKPVALRTCINEVYSSGLLHMQATTYQLNLFISISAATFESSLFHERLPNCVRYGVMSTAIGHEMGHIIGPTGIYFGIDPTEPLFTIDLENIYSEHFQCFVDVFDDYSTGNTKKSNAIKNDYEPSIGRLSLDENFADWSGLQVAFSAYKEVEIDKKSNGELKLPGLQQFTDDQMFFISFAQTWCSATNSESFEKYVVKYDPHNQNNIRVIGTVSQTPAFAEAFDCPKNSPMNPEAKCNMWINQTIIP